MQVKRRKGWRMSCDVGKARKVLSSARSPSFPSLHLRHSSFSNPSVASSMPQLILQPLFRFSYVTGAFSNPSVSSSMPQLILQPLFRFSYVTGSFSNPSVASSTSQVILRPFFRFSYIAGSSPTSPGESPMENSLLSQFFPCKLPSYPLLVLFSEKQVRDDNNCRWQPAS